MQKLRPYIDRSAHPFWSAYHTSPPVLYDYTYEHSNLRHFLNRLPASLDMPYIMDYEHILITSGFSRDYKRMLDEIPRIEFAILNENCKALVGATWGTFRETARFIPNILPFQSKFHKILPAISVKGRKNYLRISSKPFTILNIGNKFWGKGTHLAVEIYKRLRAELGRSVRMIIVCDDFPEDFCRPPGLTLISVSQLSQLYKDFLFSESHCFLFPCLHDSFGVYLECLSYGLPVITTNIYDKNEIVIEDVTGYLVETPLQLYGAGFGETWRDWGEFQSKCEEYFIDGRFESLIGTCFDIILKLNKDRCCLERLSAGASNFCELNLAIDEKNRKVVDLYRRIMTN
jgi:glycosyltransferase involved in cell wall biosynthesis